MADGMAAHSQSSAVLQASATFSSVISESELEAQRATLAQAAAEMETEVEDESVTSGSSPSPSNALGGTLRMTSSEDKVAAKAQAKRHGKRRKGLESPKPWSAEAIRLDKDRGGLAKYAASRSRWKPQNMPKEERAEWNQRHQVTYTNSGLHQNTRSYFDRFIEFQQKMPAESYKPNWRLDPGGSSIEERAEMIELSRSLGPQARPELSGLGPPDMLELPPSSGTRQREKEELHDEHSVKAPLTFERSVSEAAITSQRAHWDDRHNVVWCNERYTTGPKLNPPLLRSYFDRVRHPGNARGEAMWRCEREEVLDKLDRLRPLWRLPVDPLEDAPTKRSTTEATPGGGGAVYRNPEKDSAAFAAAITAATDTDTRDPAFGTISSAARRRTWNQRHQLTFQNEEVSRLDRSYFDRWREPACDSPIHKAAPKAHASSRRGSATTADEQQEGEIQRPVVQGLKPTWSLERDGSPDRVAAELVKQTGYRHTSYGKWDPRHQRIFVNEVHTNLKNYFDRSRVLEEMAGSRQREKITDQDKLKVDNWSMQLYGPPQDFSKLLRSESAPELQNSGELMQRILQLENESGAKPAAGANKRRQKEEQAGKKEERESTASTNSSTVPKGVKKKKERPAWFSSHGVYF